ncbi:hypothetical protein NQ317_003387 [Molorchus minor]|uniref:Exosome complex component RRP45 n=1 Tax=Molorchus minor TaxID=1323400 RepID=A0ABQ9K975_9CUCU|nr:hypothetical protein NQ317_003387 [Molorchus minor]
MMSSVRKAIVSNCEKKFLIKNLAEWTRLDGRAFDEFREIQIEFGKDWGCCYVSLGKTKVLAQVSCEIQQPKSSRPSEGILNINIELNPIAAPHFEAGRQSDLSVQLNRLLEKCLKDSKAVDLESLCIKMNEKVWALRLDINVLNHEGNILDCASIAALAALAHFRRPDVTSDGEEFIIHSYKQRDPIPLVIQHYPVCITYSIFNGGEFILADPMLLEENVADAFFIDWIECIQGTLWFTPWRVDVILNTTNKAASRAETVVQLIKEAIEQDNERRLEKVELGFHKAVEAKPVENSIGDLSICIDQWSVKHKKSKKKKNKLTEGEEKIIKEISETVQVTEIEALGVGSAALVPQDSEDGNRWQASDSENDDDDVMVVDIPKPVIETVDILDTGSEEEIVVILNADKKTKKEEKENKTMIDTILT